MPRLQTVTDTGTLSFFISILSVPKNPSNAYFEAPYGPPPYDGILPDEPDKYRMSNVDKTSYSIV